MLTPLLLSTCTDHDPHHHASSLPPADGSGGLHLPPTSEWKPDDMPHAQDPEGAKNEPFHLARFQGINNGNGITKKAAEDFFSKRMSVIALCQSARPILANALAQRERVKEVWRDFIKSVMVRHDGLLMPRLASGYILAFDLVLGGSRSLRALGRLSHTNHKSGLHEAYEGFIRIGRPSGVTLATDGRRDINSNASAVRRVGVVPDESSKVFHCFFRITVFAVFANLEHHVHNFSSRRVSQRCFSVAFVK